MTLEVGKETFGQGLSERITRLTDAKACVAATEDVAGLKSCRQSLMEWNRARELRNAAPMKMNEVPMAEVLKEKMIPNKEQTKKKAEGLFEAISFTDSDSHKIDTTE